MAARPGDPVLLLEADILAADGTLLRMTALALPKDRGRREHVAEFAFHLAGAGPARPVDPEVDLFVMARHPEAVVRVLGCIRNGATYPSTRSRTEPTRP